MPLMLRKVFLGLWRWLTPKHCKKRRKLVLGDRRMGARKEGREEVSTARFWCLNWDENSTQLKKTIFAQSAPWITWVNRANESAFLSLKGSSAKICSTVYQLISMRWNGKDVSSEVNGLAYRFGHFIAELYDGNFLDTSEVLTGFMVDNFLGNFSCKTWGLWCNLMIAIPQLKCFSTYPKTIAVSAHEFPKLDDSSLNFIMKDFPSTSIDAQQIHRHPHHSHIIPPHLTSNRLLTLLKQ